VKTSTLQFRAGGFRAVVATFSLERTDANPWRPIVHVVDGTREFILRLDDIALNQLRERMDEARRLNDSGT
jgi:hypothetical protein